MTFERKIVVGLEDINKITFECTSCGSRISMNPDKARDIPMQCAECKKEWRTFDVERPAMIASPTFTFVDSLAKLRVIGPKNAGFRILLEFDEPKASQ
jgi:hypothetical protein